MPQRNQHVVPHEDRWAVRSAGSQRASSIHSTQCEAIAAGREIARNQGGELVIHGRDGHIRERDSYGNDRSPPKR